MAVVGGPIREGSKLARGRGGRRGGAKETKYSNKVPWAGVGRRCRCIARGSAWDEFSSPESMYAFRELLDWLVYGGTLSQSFTMYYCLLIAYLSMMNSDARIDNHYIVPLSLLDTVSKVNLCSYTQSKESGEWKCKCGGGPAPMERPRCRPPRRRLESSCMKTNPSFSSSSSYDQGLWTINIRLARGRTHKRQKENIANLNYI